jgi:hypothetical protein
MMDEKIVQQIFDELLSSLEPLDTQSAALLQFLKAKGIASDEELAPYFEQAGNTSNVRWRAARVRIGGLISSAMKPAEQPAETQAAEKIPDPAAETGKATAQTKQTPSDSQPAQASDNNAKSPKLATPDDENQKESETKLPEATKEVAKESTKKDAA